jgi:DNA-binding transcriptional LysR family regulator
MELRLLRYFLAVAREENITRAAESLHITQPSLSKQLIELEQELGKQLFIRGKRKITLTEEGVLLRKRADEILMLCEKTRREIAQDSDLIGGVISIGGTQSTVVAQATSLIADRYPGVKFQFFNGDAETLMERLDHGTLDFSILIEPVDLVKSSPKRN